MHRWVFLLALAGCNAADNGGGPPDSSTAPPDQSVPADLAAAPDLAAPPDLTAPPDFAEKPCVMHMLPGTCADLVTWTNEWIACHQACGTDGDCVNVDAHTSLMCKNACPTLTNASADGPYLQSLSDEYVKMGCGQGGCACPNPGSPFCMTGMCAK